MSAFRDLLKEAYDLGANRVMFRVYQEVFFETPEADSWVAWASLEEASGRTGEEALRRLVEKLREVK